VVVLPKIGIHHATWLFLTAERFSAERAREIGLVHRVHPRAELEAAVEQTVAALRLAGPNALRHAKELVRKVPYMSMDEAFRFTGTLIGELFASPEAQEGMRAFAEKRKPSWAERSNAD
jgi:methylglutaconyl-CoA hydratase